MQANLLNSILAPPSADSKGSQLLGEQKINSAEAELFAKLLQGSIDLPSANENKKLSSPLLGDSIFRTNDREMTNAGENNVVNLFGSQDVSNNIEASENRELVNLMASNPKLVQIFEKTDRPDELIVRLRDLMTHDPTAGREVSKLIEKVEISEKRANDILKLGKNVSSGAKTEFQIPLRRNIARIANYGQNQNIINKNIITPKKNIELKRMSDLGRAITPSKSDDLGVDVTDKIIHSVEKLAVPNRNQSMFQANSSVKVLDLSAIPSGNSAELIDKISNYVQQSNLQNRQSLDITVRHNDLGQFNINVSKMGTADQLDLQITTSSRDARVFFIQNENRLINSLEMSGIKLADVKIVAGTEFNRADSDNRGSNSDNSNSFNRGSSSQYSDRGEEESDSRRRRELWEMYKERNAA